MAESYWQRAKRALRMGRRPHAPERETEVYPRLTQIGQPADSRSRPVYKPVARNLRYFSTTPYARRAINAIKNPIAQLEWEIVPLKGLKLNSELERQIAVVTECFANPNQQDSFRSLIEQVTEDLLCGAGVIEMEISGDQARPLWMWPVDGLSIQIYAAWDGRNPEEARYFQTYGYGGAGNLSTAGIQLRDDELIYIRPNPSTAQPFGTGPLEVAFNSIARQLGVGEFAGNVASNAKPSSLIFIEGADDRALSAFRQYWTNEIEGQGKTPITGGKKTEVIRLWPDGDNALYLKWQEFLIREIATAFDLSPQNLGVEADVNRNTSEVAEDRDWDAAIKPWAHALEQALTREAIRKRLGHTQIMFRFVGLDREDEAATADIYETYYKNNAMTPNEQREKLGMSPLKSQWADMTFADFQVAVAAAKGMASDLDQDLGDDKSKPAKRPTGKKE